MKGLIFVVFLWLVLTAGCLDQTPTNKNEKTNTTAGLAREYSTDMKETVVSTTNLTVELKMAVDLENKEFVLIDSNKELFYAYVNKTYYKGITLGPSFCSYNTDSTFDFCTLIERNDYIGLLLFILPEYYKICGVDDTVYEAIDKDPTHKFSGSGITGAYTKTNAGDYLSTESEYIYGSGLVYKFWYSNTKEDKGAVQKLFKEGHAHYSVKDCY